MRPRIHWCGRGGPPSVACVLLAGLLWNPPSSARAQATWVAERLPGAGADSRGAVPDSTSETTNATSRYGLALTTRRLAGSDPLPDEYTTIPCLTLCYSVGVFPGIRLAAAAGYGRRSGSPGGDPTFVQPNGERVELVPLEFGFRFGRDRPGRFDWAVGLSALGVWMRELLPPRYGSTSGSQRRHEGFVGGGRVATGPEWRLPWNALALSGEIGLEITGVKRHEDGWEASASSVSWRLSLWREL